MDKTIRPTFPKDRTLAVSKRDFAEEHVSKPGTPHPKTDVMADLPPCLYLVNGHTTNEFMIDTNEFITSVGKSPEATITLNDNNLSPIHLRIVKLSKECLFVDRGKRDICQFNGIQSRQAFKPLNSRVVIKMGEHWMIYDATDLSTNTASIKKDLNPENTLSQEAMPGKALLQYKNRTFETEKECLLIGTHQICDIRLHTETVAEFAAMVYWNKEGVFVDKMGASRAALCHNRKRVIEPVKLEEGDVLSMGKDEIIVNFEGDVEKRAKAMFYQIDERPSLALTALNSGEPFTKALNTNNMYTVGRSSKADLQFQDPSVSRIHAKLMVREKFLTVTDNESYNKVKVNMEEVPKASVFAGDILELGSLALLVHYNSVRF
ncbi:MAG: FHA domain-containing protein [Lentisphaeraceae bacterium]|nr:FHA domain-containing protein [Lentisphaeraceae bacterium]